MTVSIYVQCTTLKKGHREFIISKINKYLLSRFGGIKLGNGKYNGIRASTTTDKIKKIKKPIIP